MQNKAPTEYRIELDYFKGFNPKGEWHDSKTVKKSRVKGKDPWQKAGNEYCNAQCSSGKWKKLGCYGNDGKNFNAVMAAKQSKSFGRRKYGCIGSKGAVDPNMKFWDKDSSGKTVWRTGAVCPDATYAKFNPANNQLVCKWDSGKVDSKLLIKLKKLSNSSEIASEVYDKLKGQFCNVVDNLNKNIDDTQTCLSADKQQKKLMTYCALGKKILPSGDALCQPSSAAGDGKLSDTAWNSLAEKYCKSNKKDPWCACYNVREKICKDKTTDAAGCKQHFEKLEALKGAIDKKTYDLMVAKKPAACLSDVCMGTPNSIFKIRGDPSPPDCTDNLNICNNIVSAGVAQNSPISANCDMTSIVQKGDDKPKTKEEEKKEKDETKELLETASKMGPLDSGDSSEKKSDDKKGGGLSPGEIAGISVGALIFCLLVIGGFVMLRK
jgi:hypothetical protein